MSESPCKTCKRVKNPEACFNKECFDWRKWFIKKWVETVEQLRRKKDV